MHHTNEIAQSESATGNKWVNYWLHGEFLIMKKGKMAKSKGVFVTLKTLIEENYDPLVFRYMCLNTHYRKKMNFAWEGLDSAQNTLSTLRENLRILKEKDNGKTKRGKIEDYRKKFLKAINDDLNMPKALDVVWNLIRDEKNISNRDKYKVLLEFDKVLGLDLENIEVSIKIPKEISNLIKKREEYRKKKDWQKADQIRKQLLKKGIILRDTFEGTVLKKSEK